MQTKKKIFQNLQCKQAEGAQIQRHENVIVLYPQM